QRRSLGRARRQEIHPAPVLAPGSRGLRRQHTRHPDRQSQAAGSQLRPVPERYADELDAEPAALGYKHRRPADAHRHPRRARPRHQRRIPARRRRPHRDEHHADRGRAVKFRFRLAVVLWLLALIGSLAVVARTQFTADMSAFLPRNPTEQQALLIDQLKEGALSRTLLIGIEGADAATRAELSQDLLRALQKDARFAAVNNGSKESQARERELVFRNRYLLSPAVTPQRFSAEGLAAAIGNSIDLLSSPAGVLLKRLLPRDPTGEIMELFGALAGDNGSPNMQFGAWASQDGERAILMTQTLAAGSDTDGQEAAIAAIRLAFANAAAQAGAED